MVCAHCMLLEARYIYRRSYDMNRSVLQALPEAQQQTVAGDGVAGTGLMVAHLLRIAVATLVALELQNSDVKHQVNLLRESADQRSALYDARCAEPAQQRSVPSSHHLCTLRN